LVKPCAASWRTVHYDRLFLVPLQRIGGLEDLVGRHQARTADVTRRVLILGAHVEHQRALVHESHQILWRDRPGALRAQPHFVGCDQQRRDQRRGGQVRMMASKFEQPIHMPSARVA
jgi:hypothetical protein